MSEPNHDNCTRVPPSFCLNCGHTLNAVAHDGGAHPRPDEITICGECGAVMMLDKNLQVRGMTDAEMDELVADRETMNAVAQVVRGIQRRREQRGRGHYLFSRRN